jgi:hypothetical protein
LNKEENENETVSHVVAALEQRAPRHHLFANKNPLVVDVTMKQLLLPGAFYSL